MKQIVKTYYFFKLLKKNNKKFFKKVFLMYFFNRKKYNYFQDYLERGCSIPYAYCNAQQSNIKILDSTLGEQTKKALDILNNEVIPQVKKYEENHKND